MPAHLINMRTAQQGASRSSIVSAVNMRHRTIAGINACLLTQLICAPHSTAPLVVCRAHRIAGRVAYPFAAFIAQRYP